MFLPTMDKSTTTRMSHPRGARHVSAGTQITPLMSTSSLLPPKGRCSTHAVVAAANVRESMKSDEIAKPYGYLTRAALGSTPTYSKVPSSGDIAFD